MLGGRSHVSSQLVSPGFDQRRSDPQVGPLPSPRRHHQRGFVTATSSHVRVDASLKQELHLPQGENKTLQLAMGIGVFAVAGDGGGGGAAISLLLLL